MRKTVLTVISLGEKGRKAGGNNELQVALDKQVVLVTAALRFI